MTSTIFKDFIENDQGQSIKNIKNILSNQHPLIDTKGNPLFVNTLQPLRIQYIQNQTIKSEALYKDILSFLFHIPNPNPEYSYQLEMDE